MTNKKYSYLFAAIFSVFLLLCNPVNAFAEGVDAVDFSKKGSVSVTMNADGSPISGAELTFYRVADASSAEGPISFDFTSPFSGFGGQPENIKTSDDILRLAQYAKDKGISGTPATTDASGKLKLSDLPLGLYLVRQTGSVNGFSDCSPFTVVLPSFERGAWIYDIDATPKTDVVRLVNITVKKVWNDGDYIDHPESVKVQLLKDKKVMKSATLSDENDWSCRWEDMPKSDAYSVKEINIPQGYTASYRKKGNDFTVTNSAKLIQTGQLVWPIPVLGFFGTIMFAIGWSLIYGVKKSDA